MMSNRLFRDFLTVIACSLTFASCAQSTSSSDASEDTAVEILKPEFLDVELEYIDSLLSTLSIEEQIAQLLMVPIYSLESRSDWAEAETWVKDLGLGGVICMQGGPENQRVRINIR